MSEHENEPVEPVEPTPDEEEEGADDEPETPFEEPPAPEEVEPEAQTPRDDADVDPIYAKLEKKAKNYTNAVAGLLKGGSIPVAGCEMCADCYPGIRWVHAQDDLHKALLSVVGAGDGASPLNADPDAQECDRCSGFGWTKLPSKVPGNENRLCRKCNGAGFADPSPESGALQPPEAELAGGPAEPLAGVPIDDPSVVDLRARGFTVIPPMQIGEPTQA